MRMALRTPSMVEYQHVNLSRGHTVTSIDNTEARLNTHEQVCNLRYESICARLKRLETIGLTAAGTIITLLVGIVLELGR